MALRNRAFVAALVLGLSPLLALSAFGQGEAATQTQKAPPREWIDPATGHRIVRLSNEPGSASLYFNFNAYTPQGDKMVITTPAGIATIDLKTFAEKPLLTIKGPFRLLFTGHKTRSAYYETLPGTPDGPKTVSGG